MPISDTIHGVARRHGYESTVVLFAALLKFPGLLLSQPTAALASPPPADSAHFCAIFDYKQWRRDHPRPAAKRLADLNVGAPRG